MATQDVTIPSNSIDLDRVALNLHVYNSDQNLVKVILNELTSTYFKI